MICFLLQKPLLQVNTGCSIIDRPQSKTYITRRQSRQNYKSSVAPSIAGPPRPNFGRQDRQSGSHVTDVPPLLPQSSILQNPGKTAALAVLPLVAALYEKCMALTNVNSELFLTKLYMYCSNQSPFN